MGDDDEWAISHQPEAGEEPETFRLLLLQLLDQLQTCAASLNCLVVPSTYELESWAVSDFKNWTGSLCRNGEPLHHSYNWVAGCEQWTLSMQKLLKVQFIQA